MSCLCIRGARVLDPAEGADEVRDLWVCDGAISAAPAAQAARVIEAAGLIAAPGLVDVHVHLREPGGEDAETIESGCRAAVAGGFTSIACMPNTSPPLDTPERVGAVLARVGELGLCRVAVVACITRGRRGEELSDFAALARAGAIAVSDDGNTVPLAGTFRRALQEARRAGLVVADHCEDAGLAGQGVINEGEVSCRLGLPGRPASAEDVIVARDLLLAEETGARLHLQHLSTARSVELLRRYRSRGAPVTAEATPHHLALTEEDVVRGGPDFKMNPPLRTRRDLEALRSALADGTIDCVASDHAPHPPAAKAKGLLKAPAGAIGLETALAVLWTELVLPGLLVPLKLIERMSLGSARAFGLPGGSLSPGSPADIVLFDPDQEWIIDPERFRSRSRNCPFAGRKVRGKVVGTIVGGAIRYGDL